MSELKIKASLKQTQFKNNICKKYKFSNFDDWL